MIPEKFIGTLDIFIFALIFFSLFKFGKKTKDKN